jgi:hypothetical protein
MNAENLTCTVRGDTPLNRPSEAEIGVIVHEYNNLLQTICGYTNYALMDLPADSLVRGDLEEVMTAGKRAIELTQRLDAWRRKTEGAIDPGMVCPDIQNVLT